MATRNTEFKAVCVGALMGLAWMAALALLAASLLASPSARAQANPFAGKWIDLTHDFDRKAIYWPTADTFKKETVFEGMTAKGFYYTAYNIRAAEHGGTHMDSPIHFAKGRQTTEQVPLERLMGPAVVIRIADKAAKDRNYQLSRQDILDWEAQHGQIPKGVIVLVDTGSSKLWPDRMAYMGTDKRGEDGVRALRFPGIHPDAAKLLAQERDILSVGIDSPSLDFGGSTLFETHRILFDKNIPGFENVANLDQLPITGAHVIALPMKIKGGSGAPLRIVALIAK